MDISFQIFILINIDYILFPVFSYTSRHAIRPQVLDGRSSRPLVTAAGAGCPRRRMLDKGKLAGIANPTHPVAHVVAVGASSQRAAHRLDADAYVAVVGVGRLCDSLGVPQPARRPAGS